MDEGLYALADANFNVTAVTDSSGAVVERFAYTPYGDSTVLDASFAPKSGNNSTLAWKYRYTTRERDPDTGLQLNRFRWYASHLGRWVNRDPIGYWGRYNLYGYVAEMPTKYVDPLGLLEVIVWPPQPPHNPYGHAAIRLKNGRYISWWPDGNRNFGFLDWGYPFNSYTAPAIPNRLYNHDLNAEGGRLPNITVINGLDENAIELWWDNFSHNGANKWCTATQNCSTVAATALEEGGADVDWLDSGDAHNVIWSPEDVLDYADAINRHMEPPCPSGNNPGNLPGQGGCFVKGTPVMLANVSWLAVQVESEGLIL